jgi:hypothetical protein
LLAHERNTSAPSPPNLARTAWETIAVLGHYVGLEPSQLKEVVLPWPEYLPDRDPQVVLALAAIRVARPGYLQFGLGLLRDHIRQNPDSFPVKQYFRLVGELDPVRAYPVPPPPLPSLTVADLAYKLFHQARTWWSSRR